jgi:hypothetical protein
VAGSVDAFSCGKHGAEVREQVPNRDQPTIPKSFRGMRPTNPRALGLGGTVAGRWGIGTTPNARVWAGGRTVVEVVSCADSEL